MLEMRSRCERCATSLAPDRSAAYICSLECTFCADCAANALDYVCPNCAGELVRRPTRAGRLLKRFPPTGKGA